MSEVDGQLEMDGAEEVLEGEVVGYSVRGIYSKLCEELDACTEKHLFNLDIAWLVKQVIGQWTEALLQQGAETINFHKE